MFAIRTRLILHCEWMCVLFSQIVDSTNEIQKIYFLISNKQNDFVTFVQKFKTAATQYDFLGLNLSTVSRVPISNIWTNRKINGCFGEGKCICKQYGKWYTIQIFFHLSVSDSELTMLWNIPCIKLSFSLRFREFFH